MVVVLSLLAPGFDVVVVPDFLLMDVGMADAVCFASNIGFPLWSSWFTLSFTSMVSLGRDSHMYSFLEFNVKSLFPWVMTTDSVIILSKLVLCLLRIDIENS